MFSYLDTFTKIYLLILALFLGLVMGSGLNCLAYRIAHKEKWSGGRSKCPRCGHVLSARDLIPVVSYVTLKGRCRYCGEKISPRYCIAELILGLCYPIMLLRYGLTADCLVMLILMSCLFCLSLVDLDAFEIPNRFLVIPLVARLGQFIYERGFTLALLWAILPAAGVFIGLLLLILVMDKVFKKETMGGGDIKLLTLLALFFPFPQWLLLVFIACLAGIALAAALGTKKGIAFPFGPAISLAAFLTALAGEPLVGWYLGLF